MNYRSLLHGPVCVMPLVIYPERDCFLFFGDSPVNFVYFGPCTAYFDGLIQLCCLADQGSPSVMQHVVSVESSSLLLHCIKTLYLFSVMIH